MIAADSNVLLRFLTRDDPVQSPRAQALIAARSEHDPIYVPLRVLVETIWTLRRIYRLSQTDVHLAFRTLLGNPAFSFEETAAVRRVFEAGDAERVDIADHFIAFSAAKAGCTTTMTFDRRAARPVAGMTLLA